MTAYLGIPTGSNVHWVWNGSAWVLSPYGGGSGGGEVSASYIVLGLTSSLANERVLTAGSGISIIDGGPGGNLTISSTGGGGSSTGTFAAFHGFTTSSIDWSATGSWTPFVNALGNFTDSITQNIVRTNSEFAVIDGGFYYFHAGFNAYGSDAYISLRLRQSGTNTVALKRATYRSTPTDQNLVVLDGIFSSAAGISWDLEYISSGTILPWTPANPQVGGENMFTGEVSIFLAPTAGPSGSLSAGGTIVGPLILSGGLTGSLQQTLDGLSYLVAGSGITIVTASNGQITIASSKVPIYSIPIMTGIVSTNIATTGSKQSLGSMYFDPTLISRFSGSKSYYYRVIVDTSETAVSAAVDLYDINAIVAYPPGIIQNSTMSSSNMTMSRIEANLTSILSSVTGSGIFEARLWRTISGSLTSSIACRQALLEIEYS